MSKNTRLISIDENGKPNEEPLSLIGLSSDTKPTTGIPKGSRFTEIDTNKIYHFDGSSWVEFNYNVKGEFTQTGSIVESEELIARDVYDTTQSIILDENDIPERAKRAIFSIIVSGITGTFDTGEGISLDINNSFEEITSNKTFLTAETIKENSTAGTINIILDTGAEDTTIYDDTERNRDTVVVKVRLLPAIRLRMRIDGTFGTDEGFDAKLIANWLY